MTSYLMTSGSFEIFLFFNQQTIASMLFKMKMKVLRAHLTGVVQSSPGATATSDGFK